MKRRAALLFLIFWPLTAVVLHCDARAVSGDAFSGQLLSDLLTPLFLLALLSQMRPERQLMVALFVPLSAVGEGIFSLLLGFYRYRLGGVPLYVPCGHAVLLAVGLGLSDLAFVLRHEKTVRQALLLFHGALVTGALLLFGDTLSVAFAAIFGVLLYRARGRVFYLIMGVLVLYIELLGTAWGCWVWVPRPLGVLHTVNPPVGAFACYVIADILCMKIARRLSKLRRTATDAAPELALAEA